MTPDPDSNYGPKEAGLQLQLQNVMCDMLIMYFTTNGENLILLIRRTTDGATSIALDLNNIHMNNQCTIKEKAYTRSQVSLEKKTPTPTPPWFS